MDNIPQGRHLAHPIDYGLTETKAGDPQVRVKFKLDGDGSEITWMGSLKEGKAREITIDALLVLGFRGNDLMALEGGAGSNAIAEDKAVSITVEDETYEGKTRTRVKWVNAVSGGFKKMDASKGASLKAMSADVMARRKEKGVPEPVDDLPF